LYSILDNHPTIFLRNNGYAYSINPSLERVELLDRIDPLTYYLLETENIIIP